MKLKLDIKQGTHKKSGWFGKTIPIHELHIDLQLTDEEKAIAQAANIMEHYFTTEDWMEDITEEQAKENFGDTGGRFPARYGHFILSGKKMLRYHTLVGARKALEETKQGMIELKALLEQANDPSANSFEL